METRAGKSLEPTIELQINNFTTGAQRNAAVAPFGEEFLVVWQSPSLDGDGLGIIAQVFSIHDGFLGGQPVVNSTITTTQRLPAVTSDSSGWWVVWESLEAVGSDNDQESIVVRRVDATGLPTGVDAQVNSTILGRQRFPSVAGLATGGVIVVWQSESSAGTDSTSWSVQGQRFDAMGVPVGSEFQLNDDTSGGQTQPDLAAQADGQFVAVWRNRSEIVARKFDAAGMPVTAEIPVNLVTADVQQQPAVAVASDGSFMVVWQSAGADGFGESARYRLFDAAGLPMTGELDLPTVVTGDQVLPDVGVDDQGRFVATWIDIGRDGDLGGVFARRFHPDGSPLADDFILNSQTAGDQQAPAVGVTSAGDLLFVWEGDTSLFDSTSWGILGRAYRKTRAELEISIADDVDQVTPGDSVTFTISSGSTGPEPVENVQVTADFPDEVSGPDWNCVPPGSATCISGEMPGEVADGTGDFTISIDLPVDESVSIEAISEVLGGTEPGTMTASVSVSGIDVVDSDAGNDTDSVTVEVVAADFGDAPDDFPVLAVQDGARHVVVPGMGLGFSGLDSESDGQPSPLADGDGADDQDGIEILTDSGDLVICTMATLEASILAPVDTFLTLDGWFDFNNDLIWSAGERAVDAEVLGVGLHQLSFQVPCEVQPVDPIFGRFRLSTAGSDGVTGRADDGEVEDYAFRLVSQSDVRITQVVTSPPIPGTNLKITVSAINDGPSPAVAEVTASFAGLGSVEWDCDETGGGSCSVPAGTGALVSTGVTLPPGSSVDFLVSGDLGPGVTGTFDHTATILLTSGTDPDLSNNVSMLSQALTPTADLSLTKSNGQDVAVIGDWTQYEILVSNLGPSDSPAAMVSDTPLELTDASWTCEVVTGNASCIAGMGPGTADAGVGGFSQSVDLPVDSQIRFLLSGRFVDAQAPLDLISNTATVVATTTTELNVANGEATDPDPVAQVDYGDAPDCTPQPDCGPPAYATLLINDGARHVIRPGIALGSELPDAELDGQQSSGATGDDGNGEDDEDGFVNRVFTEFTACETALVDLVAVVDSGQLGGIDEGFLNAWIDFNADGDWLDDGEHLFGGVGLLLSAGLNSDIPIDIPCDAVPGFTGMRLRFSTLDTLDVTGLAPDGEVEDYFIEILGLDFGDAACVGPTCVQTYPTLLEDDGARHVLDGFIRFGSLIDSEPVPMPTENADGDDLDGSDDEDGVVFVQSSLDPESTAQVEVTLSSACDDKICAIQGWIDFNRDGIFAPDEQVLENEVREAGTHILDIAVPAIAEPGAQAIGRFRVSSVGDLEPTGRAPDGEVEDHPVDLTPVANLAIDKYLVAPAVPGQIVEYEVTITNPGPNAVTGASVADFPPALLEGLDWSCVVDAGGVCVADPVGPAELTGSVDLPVGTTATFTLEGFLPADAEAQLGGADLINRAEVTVPSGVINLAANDPDDPEGRLKAVKILPSPISPQADVSVTVSDSATSAVAGTILPFQVVIANAGISDTLASVTHTFPQAEAVTWTGCVALGGAVCPLNTSGLVNLTDLSLPAGSSLTLQLEALLLSTSAGTTTENRVVIVPGGDTNDQDSVNNTSIDDDTLIRGQVALRLAKVDDFDPVQDGTMLTYTFTVTNDGPSEARAVRVVEDMLPVEIVNTVMAGCLPDPEDPAVPDSCFLGDIPVFEARSFTLTGLIDTAASSLIMNSASLQSATELLPTVDDRTEETCVFPADEQFPLSRLQGDLSAVVVTTGPTGFGAVWESVGGDGPDTKGSSIRLRMLEADGSLLLPSSQVNVIESGDQKEPDLAFKPSCPELDEGEPTLTEDACAVSLDGSFVVVWAGQTSDAGFTLAEDVPDTDGFSIRARRFDPETGMWQDEFQVNDYTTGEQRNPTVAVARDGSFLVAWESFGSPGNDASNQSVQARVFGADGLPKGEQYQVNELTSGSQIRPDAATIFGASANEDTFVLVWQSEGSLRGDDQEGFSIQGRRYDTFGTDLGQEQQVNVTIGGDQTAPAVDSNGEGTFAVAWQSETSTGDVSGTSVLLRRFTPSFEPEQLDPARDEIQANDQAVGDQQNPSIAVGEDRNVTVVWQSPGADETDIVRRSFSPDNTGFAGDIFVNTYDTGSQTSPSIAVQTSGDFLVAWQGPDSICRDSATVSGFFTNVEKADLRASFTAPLGNPVVVTPGEADSLVMAVEFANLSTENVDVQDALINILPPDQMNARWCCTASAGATCPVGSSCPVNYTDFEIRPLVNETIDLAAGSTATFSIISDVDALAQGELEVPASIAVGAGAADDRIDNNLAVKILSLTPQADLSVTKDDGLTVVTPGAECVGFEETQGCLTYDIVVENAGPSAAYEVAILDEIPVADLLCENFTCDADASASCDSEAPLGTDLADEVRGDGMLSLSVNMLPGSRIDISIPCTVRSEAAGMDGTLVNEVTVTPPEGVTDPDVGNNLAEDKNTALQPQADLMVTITGPVEPVQTGSSFDYKVEITNLGESLARNVSLVVDSLDRQEFVGSDPDICDWLSGPEGPFISCELRDDLARDITQPISLTLRPQLTPEEVGNVSLASIARAEVSADTEDLNLDNNEAFGSVQLRRDFLIGPDFGDQIRPAVDMLPNGETVVVWDSNLFDISQRDIRLQRLGLNGRPMSTPEGDDSIVVNTYTADDQVDPRLAVGPGGELLVVWVSEGSLGEDDDGNSIQAQLFNPAGDPVGGQFQVNTIDALNQINPDVAAVTTETGELGGFVVVWQGQSETPTPESEAEIFAQWLNPDGSMLGDETQINTYTNDDQRKPSVAVDRRGVFTFTWESIGSLGTDTGTSIQTRRFDSDRNPIDPEDVQVNTDIQNDQESPRVAVVPTGESLILWESFSGVELTDIRGQFICRDLNEVRFAGGELQLSSAEAGADQVNPALDYIGLTDFVLTWNASAQLGDDLRFDDEPLSTDSLDAGSLATKVDRLVEIRERCVFNPGEKQVDEGTSIDLDEPDVAFQDGRYVIVWHRKGRIFARLANLDLPEVPDDGLFSDDDEDGVVEGCDRCPGDSYSVATDDGIDLDGNGFPDCAEADLTVVKQLVNDQGIPILDGENVIPGSDVTYRITLSSNGPGSVVGATLEDIFSEHLHGRAGPASPVEWDCFPVGPASCISGDPIASIGIEIGDDRRTGNIEDHLVDLQPGGQLVFTVYATVASGATGTLENTAAVELPANREDFLPDDNSSTTSHGLNIEANLTITKSNGVDEVVPGQQVDYVIEICNEGPSDVVDAPVTDLLRDELELISCVDPIGQSCDPAPEDGQLVSFEVSLSNGQCGTATIRATLMPSALTSLENTASVVEPDSDVISSTDTDVVTPKVDLAIVKEGPTEVVPGESIDYTIVVSNNGPVDASGANVVDHFPAGLSNIQWQCNVVDGGFASCVTGQPGMDSSGNGDISLPVDVGVGEMVTFTVTADIDIDATGTLIDGVPTLVNEARVEVPGGFTELEPANNISEARSSLKPKGDLSISITNGQSSVVAGEEVVYTIDVRNPGPSQLTGVTVSVPKPQHLVGVSWTCEVLVTGNACAPSSGGDEDLVSTVTLVPDASPGLRFVLRGTVDPNVEVSATLEAVATVTGPAGSEDPNPSNNEDTDTDPIFQQADVAVSITDGISEATPGESVTYTISVTNAGPSLATGITLSALVSDKVSCGQWTCDATNGAVDACPEMLPMDTTWEREVTVSVGGGVMLTAECDIDSSQTGQLESRASVVFLDTEIDDNNDVDLTDLQPEADLGVVKTNESTTVGAGGTVGYLITVTNDGPSDATGTQVTDNLLEILDAATWSCIAEPPASCIAGEDPGTDRLEVQGTLAAIVDLPANASLIFEIEGDVPGGCAGNLINKVIVTPDPSITDPGPTPNMDTEQDECVLEADLYVTKTDNSLETVPGEEIVYTIIAGNHGPGDAIGATISDVIPAELTGATWECVPSEAANCGQESGSGGLDLTVDLPAGESVEITLSATVKPSARDKVTNTVSISLPPGAGTDQPLDNNTDMDMTTLTPEVKVAIEKTSLQTAVVAGETVEYLIRATNVGPSDALALTVIDAFDGDLTVESCSCNAPGTASCQAGGAQGTDVADCGTGDLNATVDIPVNQELTFTVIARLSASTELATLSNTASLSLPDGTTDPDEPTDQDNTSTLVLNVQTSADLQITKTNALDEVVAGLTYDGVENPVLYQIVVSNPTGPSDVPVATVTDMFPADLVGVTWDCQPAGGASCEVGSEAASLEDQMGDISQDVVLPVGGVLTFEVQGTVSSSMTTGPLSNTASVASTVPDPETMDNMSTHEDALGFLSDLAITKTGLGTVVPGQVDGVSYTIQVSNAGPSDVFGALVSDDFPDALINVNWSCATDAVADGVTEASCETTEMSGTGSMGADDIAANVDLPAGSSITYTVTATLASSFVTGPLSNTAEVEFVASDQDPLNNSSTHEDALSVESDLQLTKTNMLDTVIPGVVDGVSYTIQVSNTGPSDVFGALVSDEFPDALINVNWSCATDAVADGVTEASCETTEMPGTGSMGAGDIASNVDLPAGSSITFSVTATLDPSFVVGPLSNTATVEVVASDQNELNNSDTHEDAVEPHVDLVIVKEVLNNPAEVVQGGTANYRITVSNSGPSTAIGALVTDGFGAGFDPDSIMWSCSLPDPANGASCVTGMTEMPLESQTDAINQAVDLPPGTSVTFMATVEVAADPGELTNTATVSAPAGTTEDDPATNTSDATITVTSTPGPDVAPLLVTKVGMITPDPEPEEPGTIEYTITVSNTSDNETFNGVAVEDIFPETLNNVSWTCAATGGASASCPVDPDPPISGDIIVNIDLPPGGAVTYTVSADLTTVEPVGACIGNIVKVDHASFAPIEVLEEDCVIFVDGFESGDTSAWDVTTPPLTTVNLDRN